MRSITIRIFILLLGLFILTLAGCDGTTNQPTTPTDGKATPTPTADKDDTPASVETSCDHFADTITATDIETLYADGIPVVINMECASDIDWYKIEFPSSPVELEVSLLDLPQKGDFDIVLYDADEEAIVDGRSALSGNADEKFTVVLEGVEAYLQIYAYTGAGQATLIVKANDVAPDAEPTPDEDEPEATPTPAIEQLTYEEVLADEFPFYPRGTISDVLEKSVETVITKPITCQLLNSELSGEFKIGNFAHVERDLLRATDYIDGWGLVVFNGSKELLDLLELTIRVSIFAPELELEIEIPPNLEMNGNEYLTTKTESRTYYLAHSYGDLFGNSAGDIRVSSGVVGNLGDLFTKNIFAQQIEIEWQYEDADGTSCSGNLTCKQVLDFESARLLKLSNASQMPH